MDLVPGACVRVRVCVRACVRACGSHTLIHLTPPFTNPFAVVSAFQIGVPSDVAVKELDRKPAGAFVVYGLNGEDDALRLAYKKAGGAVDIVDVLMDQDTGGCRIPAFGNATGKNLEHVLVNVLKSDEHKSTLAWPPTPAVQARMVSPSFVRGMLVLMSGVEWSVCVCVCVRVCACVKERSKSPPLLPSSPPSCVCAASTMREEPWNWWQVDVDTAAALEVLNKKKDGAFVVRKHPSGTDQSFVLSYKFMGKIIHEDIVRTPASKLAPQGAD